MKIYRITFSPTGMSRGTAEEILKGFGDEPVWIDLCEEPTKTIEIEGDSICIFSVPCYGGRIPRTAAERLLKIRGNQTPAIVCVTFGNRAFEDALLELADIVQMQGFSVFAGCGAATEHNIMGIFGAGRPDGADRKAMHHFSCGCIEKFQEGSMTRPDFPGERPYKIWKGMSLPIRVDESLCRHCGVCAAKCPVHAISEENTTDENLCIHCMRCVKICPEKGRYIPEEILDSMQKRMDPVCEERKQNQFYL